MRTLSISFCLCDSSSSDFAAPDLLSSEGRRPEFGVVADFLSREVSPSDSAMDGFRNIGSSEM